MRRTKPKRRGLVAALATAALTITGISGLALASPASADPGEGKNVALASAGGKVTAIGQEVPGQWGPEKAIDGNKENVEGASGSRWSSSYRDDAWIMVELAAATKIDHVNIYWEDAWAKKYTLLVSNDGTTFTPATEVTAGKCGQDGELVRHELKAEVADQAWKYVKLQADGRCTTYGISLWEFEVWDGPEPAPPAPVEKLSLIPLPVSVTELDGQDFTLTDTTQIVADADSAAVANLLAEQMRAATGLPLTIGAGSGGADISLKVNTALDTSGLTSANLDEAYTLSVTTAGVEIVGKSAHGVWNGTRTLLQLFPAFIFSPTKVNANWVAKGVTVKDAPRFEYRGMQADMARSFLAVEDIKAMIDTLANVKGSRLHMHLADDQGWRIEITNEGKDPEDPIDYTQLTARAGKTAMNQHEGSYRPDGWEGQSELGHVGFYTQDEFKEIQRYAAERFVTIVPEIDVPGHTNAALYSIPQLNSKNSSHNGTVDEEGNEITDPAQWITAPANSTGNVGYSYLDPDSKYTEYFIKHVFGQIAAMTDGQLIHMGGDESHAMHQRLGQTKINQFLDMAASAIRATGKNPIGWNEIAANTLQPGDGIQYWVGGTGNTKRAVLQEGAKVLISKSNASYIDQKYSVPGGNAMGLTWAGGGDFPKYYDWDPVKVITGLQDQHIYGNEAPQWSETIRGISQAEWMAWPRAISHAEIGWTPQAQRDVADFKLRMAGMGDRLVAAGTNFFDGPNARWRTSLVGVDTAVAPNRDIRLVAGLFAAPGTSTDSAQVETVANSASALTEAFSATIDWGDGTTTDAVFTQDQPRDPVHRSGVYQVGANHAYAAAGTYNGTITASDGRTASFTVKVADGTADPTPTPWDPSVTPQIAIEKDRITAYDRVKIDLTGFKPNEYVMISWAGDNQFLVRTDADGAVSASMPFLESMTAGLQDLKATQGDRTATVKATLNGGFDPLKNPIDHTHYSVVDFSSEEKHGETAPNGPAVAAIDGNKNSFWHTKWQGGADPMPHHITIKLDEPGLISGLEYTPRANNTNTRAKDYQIFVSEDGSNWGDPVAAGTYKSSAAAKVTEFENAKYGQYVKFVILSSQNGDNFGGAAEIVIGGVLGAQPEPTEVTPVAPEFKDEPGTGSDVVVIPAVDGVKYLINGVEAAAGDNVLPAGTAEVTVTAQAIDGYKFPADAVAEWKNTFGTEEPAPAEDPCVAAGNCLFYLVNDWTSTKAHTVFRFGDGTYDALVGDWDGDGIDTVALRSGYVYSFRFANATGADPNIADQVLTFGQEDDEVYVGDWDGDGIDTLMVRRGNRFFVKNRIEGGNADFSFDYGKAGDEVYVGDWNGDGIDTLAVRRGNEFFLRNSISTGIAHVTFHYGRAGDLVLVGDWDGDGVDSFTVRRGNEYFMANSHSDGPADTVLSYGKVTDEVLVGDWDGDGIDTLGVYRRSLTRALSNQALLS